VSGVQPPAVDGERLPAPPAPRRVAPREKSVNSHLENGHPARYSGHMSTYCAAAAPTRYPPGEAHSLPAPAPLVTAVAGEIAHCVGMSFVGGDSDADAAFHSEPPSLLHAASGSETPPTTARNQTCRPALSLPATPQLPSAQPLRARVAKNASGDTRRHATAAQGHRGTGVRSLSSITSVILSGAKDLATQTSFQILRFAQNDATVT
jgi:hypothetical protein